MCCNKASRASLLKGCWDLDKGVASWNDNEGDIVVID